MSTYFSPKSFTFLRGLARHNDKTWFNEHKPQYEEHVRQPFLRLIADLQPDLANTTNLNAILAANTLAQVLPNFVQIGRASCRERV